MHISDYRSIAISKLPSIVFDYLDGGAERETGIAHNRQVLDAIRFRPKRLVDVSSRDTSINLMGGTISAPIIVAPTGMNSLFWRNADCILAKVATEQNIPFVLSTASTSSIEEVANACCREPWFQLYVIDRKQAKMLVDRAIHAGYSTLVLTVDATVNGIRDRDLRNGFHPRMKPSLALFASALSRPAWTVRMLRDGLPRLANFESESVEGNKVQQSLTSRLMDASFSLDDLSWLREKWPKRLVVKGIVNAQDVCRCIKVGVDGVVLSNHGGRQLDSCISPMELLPEVSNVGIDIMVDSGFRRGSDVLKAIASGAKAVMLGRSILYGLAANGEAGVRGVIESMKHEIDTNLAQIGCASMNALTYDYLSK